MTMLSRITVVLIAGTLVSRPARADHHGGMTMSSSAADESTVEASVSLIAAQYDSMYYGGDYQGVISALRWSRDRFGASANVGVYRLQENGLRVYGLGDVVVQGQARLVDDGYRHAGVSVAVSAPTGADSNGLGMGHFMAMPSMWGTWMVHPVTFSVSAGFGRALADLGDHLHGMWPLVEPMNMSEVTWGGGAAVSAGYGVNVTARIAGGDPIAAPGVDHIVGALRVDWGNRRVSTGAELQAGVIGDPFKVRGVVDTAFRF
jgi:hypothetical protein